MMRGYRGGWFGVEAQPGGLNSIRRSLRWPLSELGGAIKANALLHGLQFMLGVTSSVRSRGGAQRSIFHRLREGVGCTLFSHHEPPSDRTSIEDSIFV